MRGGGTGASVQQRVEGGDEATGHRVADSGRVGDRPPLEGLSSTTRDVDTRAMIFAVYAVRPSDTPAEPFAADVLAAARTYLAALDLDPASARLFVDDAPANTVATTPALAEVVRRAKAGELGAVVQLSKNALFASDVAIRAVQEVMASGAQLLTVIDARLVQPDELTVKRLWACDGPTWQPLLEALMGRSLGRVAPRSFCAALTAVSTDVDAWTKLAMRAVDRFRSKTVDSVLGVKDAFSPWLMAGMRKLLPASDPSVLDARLMDIVNNAAGDVVARSRDVLREIGAHAPNTQLHYNSLCVHAARCLEEQLWDEAETAASTARDMKKGNEIRSNELPMRQIAVTKIARGDFDAGLELIAAAMKLDDVLYGSPPLPVLGTKRFRLYDAQDPTLALPSALEALVFYAQCSAADDDEWLESLEQFKRARGALSDTSPTESASVKKTKQ